MYSRFRNLNEMQTKMAVIKAIRQMLTWIDKLTSQKETVEYIKTIMWLKGL
jgi:hypothetical protein